LCVAFFCISLAIFSFLLPAVTWNAFIFASSHLSSYIPQTQQSKEEGGEEKEEEKPAGEEEAEAAPPVTEVRPASMETLLSVYRELVASP
jgi:hypothetical protein